MSSSETGLPPGTAISQDDMQTKGRSRIQIRNGKKILEAGEQVFAQFGYHGATLEKVAELADMSQPNLHHYFKTKADLYLAVINEVLTVWLEPLGTLDAAGEPETELRGYIARKMELARIYPAASRIFAHEILLGAPVLQPILDSQVKAVVDRGVATIRHWVESGQLQPIDPYHLIFMIWGATQHYADFMPQIRAVTGVRYKKADFEAARDSICEIILRGILVR
jgi:TetR/AcrR family transcriptional regulator